jgi:hypothetical protein
VSFDHHAKVYWQDCTNEFLATIVECEGLPMEAIVGAENRFQQSTEPFSVLVAGQQTMATVNRHEVWPIEVVQVGTGANTLVVLAWNYQVLALLPLIHELSMRERDELANRSD